MNAPVARQEFIPADLPTPSYAELEHIPGMTPTRFPILRTLKFLANPLGRSRELFEQHGRIVRRQDFGGWGVSMIGPEANEMILFNKDKIFSSEQGWGPILDQLFPRGLMLMDFDHHRIDRRALSIAFTLPLNSGTVFTKR